MVRVVDVVRAIVGLGGCAEVSEIYRALGVRGYSDSAATSVRHILVRLARSGRLVRVGRGVYCLPGAAGWRGVGRHGLRAGAEQPA